MPENTQTVTTAAAEQKFEPTKLGSASRNGLTVVVQTAQFKRQSKDKEGATYVSIDTDSMSIEDKIKFIGVDEVNSMLAAKLNQKCQGLWREAALNETGKPDSEVDDNELVWDNDKCLPVFVNALQEWSAISETITDLKEKRDDLVSQVTTVLLSGAPDAMEKANNIAQQIKKVELDIAAKKRKTKAERDAEKSAKSGGTPVPAS